MDRGIIQQQRFLPSRFSRAKLAPSSSVADRNRKGGFGRTIPACRDRDAAADQSADHGEKARARTSDLALVFPGAIDVGKPIQQRSSRNPYVIKPDPAVVNTVQAHFITVVLNCYSWKRTIAFVSDWDQKRVNPLLFSGYLQLSKNNRQPGVVRSIPNVSFSGRKRWTVDDELFVGGIVSRGRFQRLNIGPVTNLGHRETTHQLARGCVGQVFAVMRFGAQALNASGEQTKLYPKLNH